MCQYSEAFLKKKQIFSSWSSKDDSTPVFIPLGRLFPDFSKNAVKNGSKQRIFPIGILRP